MTVSTNVPPVVNQATVTGILPVANGGTGTSSFTAGSIIFSNGSILTQNNAKFFWNDTDNSLLIGKNTNSITIAGSSVKSGLIVHGGPAASSSTGQFHWHSNTDTARHLFARSRGNPTVQTIVSSGDILGDLQFVGHDGTDYEYGASLRVEVDGTPGSNNMPGRFLFLTTPSGSATPIERLRISANGDISHAGMTSGSVLFAGTGGLISQNNSAFFWDNARPSLNIRSTTGSATGANLNIYSNDNASNDSTGIGLIKGSGQGAVGISWQNSSGSGIWDQDLLHGVDDFIVRSGTAAKWSIAQYGAGAFGGDGETGTGSWGVVLQIDASGYTHVRGNTGHDARLHLEATDDTSNVQIIYTRNSATKWKEGVEPSTNNLIWSNATQVMMRLGSTGLLNVAATAAAQEGMRLSGQDFLNLSSDTSGPCLLNYVNAATNRQLGIADSALLASSGTNPVIRFQPNAKQIDVVSTNATQLSLTIGITNQIFVHSGGSVGINTSGPDRKLDVLDTSGPQLRLTYTDGSVYTDFQTDSSGFTTFGSSGGVFTFQHAGTANLWQISVGNSYRWAAQSNLGITHGTSALATNATEGFLMIQSCAGTPTGTPGTIPTGQIPMVYDSTNHILYLYSGGWRGVAVA